ncbi:hypothetical protein AAKU64_003995 [Undibacterium sp. GrIS 1.8]|uniref:hypothetical protein n=1 Tax=Undibacterium sp. GrIS 1.8 TaxID=3143934 RepID=UPI0033943949
MSIEQHLSDFLAALNGSRGELDAWLEVNNESECRAAISSAIVASSVIATLDQQESEPLQPYAYEVIVKVSGTNEVSRKVLCYEKPDIQENRHYDYEVRELSI